MQIEFIKHKVKRCDRRRIEEYIRSSNCIVNFPSTSAPFYLMDRLRRENTNEGKERRALMDNNILTNVLSLFDGRKPEGSELSIGTQHACAMVAYIIYTGMEIVPEISIYEKQTDNGAVQKRSLDDLMRIASHLTPQVYADLFAGKISDVPRPECIRARKLIFREDVAMQNTLVHNYEDSEQSGVLFAYLCMMKAWILQKTVSDENIRLEGYLQWSITHSPSSPILALVAAMVLSDKKQNEITIIKKINTSNSEVLLNSLRNLSWDLFYLCVLHDRSMDLDKNIDWCLFTRDKPLKKLANVVFSTVEGSGLEEFLLDYYSPSMMDTFSMHIGNRIAGNRSSQQLDTKPLRGALVFNCSFVESCGY